MGEALFTIPLGMMTGILVTTLAVGAGILASFAFFYSLSVVADIILAIARTLRVIR
jgi:hypothetical protein